MVEESSLKDRTGGAPERSPIVTAFGFLKKRKKNFQSVHSFFCFCEGRNSFVERLAARDENVRKMLCSCVGNGYDWFCLSKKIRCVLHRILAGETRFEHATYGFGDRYSTVEPLP